MKFLELHTLNTEVENEPGVFIDKAENNYHDEIKNVADNILNREHHLPIILISGPSGSAKTTTALRLGTMLEQAGRVVHPVSMDNYFRPIGDPGNEVDEDGRVDLESPKRLDMDLLNEHFTMLARGEEIHVPYFIFSRQKRSSTQFTRLRLEKNEVAIFEGIHAMNDAITDRHPEAFKLYISASSQFAFGGKITFLRTWLRLVRRIVRDDMFRGASAEETISMWGDVLRGEILYIDPFKYKSDHHIDTALPYEVSVMKKIALPLLENLPVGVAREDELHEMLSAFRSFESLDASYVPKDSMLREFIGGGIYQY